MASNLFGRYVWLIDLLRQYKHLSYKERNVRWQKSGLSYGEGDDLPLRTFHNHRAAIKDILTYILKLTRKFQDINITLKSLNDFMAMRFVPG